MDFEKTVVVHLILITNYGLEANLNICNYFDP